MTPAMSKDEEQPSQFSAGPGSPEPLAHEDADAIPVWSGATSGAGANAAAAAKAVVAFEGDSGTGHTGATAAKAGAAAAEDGSAAAAIACSATAAAASCARGKMPSLTDRGWASMMSVNALSLRIIMSRTRCTAQCRPAMLASAAAAAASVGRHGCQIEAATCH